MEQIKVSNEDLISYILAGKAIFTIVNPKTNKRFTYRVTKPLNCDKWFVALLTGPDASHSSDFTYIGFILPSKYFVYGRARSRLSQNAIGVLAFKWFMGHIGNLGIVEVWRINRCARCGRKLTNTIGYLGPDCSKKLGLTVSC